MPFASICSALSALFPFFLQHYLCGLGCLAITARHKLVLVATFNLQTHLRQRPREVVTQFIREYQSFLELYHCDAGFTELCPTPER